MTIKEYLMQYRRAVAEIEYTLADMEAERQRVLGLRAIIYSDMPKTRDVERDLSAALSIFEERARKLRVIIERDVALLGDIEATIRTAPTLLQFQILRLRFIDGMTLEQVAEALDKTRQWVSTVQGEALRNVDRAGRWKR